MSDLVKLLEILFDECGLNEELGFVEDYHACIAIFADKIGKHCATRITALEAENKRLREALKPFAEMGDAYKPHIYDDNHWLRIQLSDLRAARAAYLGEKKNG